MQCDATKPRGGTPGDLFDALVLVSIHVTAAHCCHCFIQSRHSRLSQVDSGPNLSGCAFSFFSLNSGADQELLTHCGSATCSGVAHSRNAYQQERVSAHMNELVLRYEAEVECVMLLCLAAFLFLSVCLFYLFIYFFKEATNACKNIFESLAAQRLSA